MKLLFFILMGFGINAQNLVSNPSFEIKSACPVNPADLSSLASWYPMQAHYGTPDYFNSCGSSFVGVPSNTFGNQSAFDGNAYIGISTYSYGYSSYREYIQNYLTSPMVAGQSYTVSFYVSCADNSRYSSNNIGAVFTQGFLYGNWNYDSLNITPNINYSTPITDTSGWTLISGTYIATGNEQFLTIGNFYDDNSTQIVNINPIGSTGAAYYYIDQVSVTQSPLGNSDFFQQKCQIVPNPVKDRFTIFSNQSEVITNIELYSTYNKVKSIKPLDSVYNIEDLPSGIYYIIVTFESNRKSISKIIKL
ncbi:T9SS type A sorting domain-containing protein [Flavobacterium sp.]|uniref:T9SS type A sorting domain-containing protein n=1 Tax=Flavobacterium sp. TaxID=239 RepID=UPI0022CA180F|nr:T9SS type A sorting domain-containing protein [Flavobacterium sp.]MCZ8091637.1 T9SS type A sorting domain-containing protein [Flavobacterium sp.]